MADHLSTAVRAAYAGGKILKRRFSNVSGIRVKSRHDMVSDADIESERAIVSIIHGKFPNHSICAEESGRHIGNSDYAWYIDPLDGTANFVIGNPYFSVSIALAHRGKVELGIVYNPVLGELYRAEAGHGAYRNGKRIHVSGKSRLESAFLMVAVLGSRGSLPEYRVTERLMRKAWKVTTSYSPALNLCNVARGRLDGVVDKWTEPVDHAAGSLIVAEAGGIVHGYDGNEFDVERTGIVASNPQLHNAILGLL